jgi:DNA-binding NarL/FixJ family response regulator
MVGIDNYTYHFIRGTMARKIDQLTDRQRDVLWLMIQGFADKEIAAMLFISLGTTKFHVSNILRLLGASNRTQAAWIAGCEKFKYTDQS